MSLNREEFQSKRSGLLVEDIMTGNVVTIQDSATISEAARAIKRSTSGCVLVKKASKLIGIVTERDFVKALASGEPETLRVADVASNQLVTIGPKDPVDRAVAILSEREVKGMPVVDGETILGILTSMDIVTFYDELSKHRIEDLEKPPETRHEVLVEDVMNTRVVTVPDSTSLNEAARVMKKNGVGCVVVIRGSDILGVVTERDVVRTLERGQADTFTVGNMVSRRVVVIGPKDSVNEAARVLADKGIKRLPVVDGKELVGILTSTDLVEFYEKLSKHMIKTIGP